MLQTGPHLRAVEAHANVIISPPSMRYTKAERKRKGKERALTRQNQQHTRRKKRNHVAKISGTPDFVRFSRRLAAVLECFAFGNQDGSLFYPAR